MLVDEEATLEQIFRHAPATIATHCEDTPTILENESLAREKFGEDVPFSEHPNIRSREACLRSSTLATELAKRENARLHVLHISTEEELNLFTPGDARITAEACVHHLWFEESGYDKLGALIKCNPAIKRASDRSAVRQAWRMEESRYLRPIMPHIPGRRNRELILTRLLGYPLFSIPFY